MELIMQFHYGQHMENNSGQKLRLTVAFNHGTTTMEHTWGQKAWSSL